MSSDRDTTRIVTSWLEDGATSLPDRVLDAVLDELPATPQRRAAWLGRRIPQMNNTAKLTLAAAAVVVAAFLGMRFLVPGQDIGGPGPTPSPTPTPVTLRQAPLAAGAYVLTSPFADEAFVPCPIATTPGCTDPIADDSIGFTFTVPDGWSGAPLNSIWLTTGGNFAPAGAGMIFLRGGWLHSDPCRGDAAGPDVAVGPTVDDLVSALADHPLLDVTDPVDVTLDGYSGKYVDLQVPPDLTGCLTSYYPWEPGLYAQGPSHQWHLWVLDVDGVRVVVQSTDYPETSSQDKAELQAIVDSIQIEP